MNNDMFHEVTRGTLESIEGGSILREVIMAVVSAINDATPPRSSAQQKLDATRNGIAQNF
jgi:hypothetical protein